MPLPAILSVDGLGSEEIVKKWKDHFSHPPCTNDFGSFRVGPDPMAVCDFLMPPFSTNGETTASLYVNRKHPPSEGVAIGYIWYPDRVRRRCEMEGLSIETVARAAVRRPAALILLTATNPSTETREAEIAVKVAGRAIHTIEGWAGIGPKIDHVLGHPEAWRYDADLGAMRLSSAPKAFSAQGSVPRPDAVDGKTLFYNLRLKAGESWTLRFVVVLGESEAAAADLFLSLIRDFDEECAAARRDWEEKIRAAFTPGNSLFSGHLPTLHTDDRELERLYYTTFAGAVLCCRRDNPLSSYGVTYITVMPNYWTTTSFVWDMMFSATCWALIDPAILRKMIEIWLGVDLSVHLATDYVTGRALGYWYAVNDTAIVRLAYTYLRYSGDLAWLDKRVGGKSILDHLDAHALRWHELDKNGHGLADCGGVLNLTECVSTWTHEVAAMNAMWVAALRQVADLRAARGETARAQALRADAEALLKNLLTLYADGKGYWRCRQPDGSYNDVRLGYDFAAVLESIPDDVSEKMRREMTEHFQREHQTRCWMHSLSPWDDDAQRDFRVDWQWAGTYPSMPAHAANGLYNIGRGEIALDWMRRVARIARQGPLGQAHWVEGLVEPFQGGAHKCAPHWPYGANWTVIANGAYLGMFVESFFGAQATLTEGLKWRDLWGSFDPNAHLENLRYQGKDYRVTRKGIELVR